MDIKKTAQEVKAEAAATQIEAVVNAWFNANIQNSIASQETEIYNHLQQAKEKLIQKLKEVAVNESI